MMIQLPPPTVAIAGSELITVPWYNYFSNQANASGYPLNARDFGAVGDFSADDTAALQAFLDELGTVGGVGVIEPGIYQTNSSLTLVAAEEISLQLWAHGAFIRPGIIADACLRINRTGANTNIGNTKQTVIEGLGIYQHNDSTGGSGIELNGCRRTILRNVKVATGNSNSSGTGYAAIRLKQSDSSDINTGAFWCSVIECVFQGGSGYVETAIHSIGLNNACRFIGNVFNAVETCILAEVSPVTGDCAADIIIRENFFEPFTYGIKPVPASAVIGWEISNNRFESGDKCIDLGGASGSGASRKTFIGPNIQAPNLTTYVYNPNSVEWYDLASATLRTDTAVATAF